MKINWRWVMGTMAVMLAGQAFAQYDNGYDYSNYSYNSGDRTFECRSAGYATTYCRVDTRYGITLVRQISTSSCIQGRSWGFDDRGVWVSNGCQARFALGVRDDRYDGGYADGYYAARVIRCESYDSRQTYCRADTRGGVQIARQLSSIYCQQGRNWNYDRSGVWVSGGCRADFSISAYGNVNPPVYAGSVVRCESNSNRTVRCNADTRGGVVLLRKLSLTSCIEGRNWGYDRYGIWVSGGCRGEFQTGGGRGRYDDDYQR